jgi:DMSO reductase family type II enzyme heme b subunit
MSDDVRKLTLAVLLVFGMAVAPVLVSARPANQIPVADVSESDAALASPGAPGWEDVSTVTVPLTSAPSGLLDASDTSISTVRVQAAHDGASMYVRLRWPDASLDRNTTGPRGFDDAAALQFPANESENPGIAMGSKRTPVNVWYWNSGSETEELLAGGPGTTTEFQSSAVQTRSVHTDGSYVVVFERPLSTDTANRTTFSMTRDVDVSVAVWNGSNMERSGRKGVSEWYHLSLGPEPTGPPYQSILWAIAGLAIVGVLAITVVAIRRTDDE